METKRLVAILGARNPGNSTPKESSILVAMGTVGSRDRLDYTFVAIPEVD